MRKARTRSAHEFVVGWQDYLKPYVNVKKLHALDEYSNKVICEPHRSWATDGWMTLGDGWVD